MSRVFKNKDNQITQKYKKGTHNGIDLVGYKNALDYIVAHSDGEVVGVRSNYKTTDKTGNSYGNYVKIKHSNGYYTLYAHLKYNSVCVSVGDKVEKGQVVGYMGATGHCTGAHLHFEVRDTSDTKIDPTPYIDADLPKAEETVEPVKEYKFKVGDKVIINGLLYTSSNAEKASGKVTNKTTVITRLAEETKHPYNTTGDLGWMDEDSIKLYTETSTPTSTTHKVVKGDTISEICTQYYGKYTKELGNKIVDANKSKYPKITLSFIQVGWVLTIPN